MLLGVGGKLDLLSQKFFNLYIASELDEFGIRDPEAFLGSLGDGDKLSRNLVVAKLEPDSDTRVLLAISGNSQSTRSSFVKDMKEDWQGEDGYSGMKTEDGQIRVNFMRGPMVIASPDDFKKLFLMTSGFSPIQELPGRLLTSAAPISSAGRDEESGMKIVDLIANDAKSESRVASTYVTATRFNKSGMERKTTSDFGFIGWIIAQLNDD